MSDRGSRDEHDERAVACHLGIDQSTVRNDFDRVFGGDRSQRKPALELLPPRAIWQVGQALTNGDTSGHEVGDYVEKVANRQGREVYIGKALRHIFASLMGDRNDPHTGVDHLANGIADLLIALEGELLANKTPVGYRALEGGETKE